MASCLVKRTQNPVLWPNEQLSIDCPCILPSNSMADCSSQHNNITTRSTQCSRTGLFSLVSFFLLFSPLFLHLFSRSRSLALLFLLLVVLLFSACCFFSHPRHSLSICNSTCCCRGFSVSPYPETHVPSPSVVPFPLLSLLSP